MSSELDRSNYRARRKVQKNKDLLSSSVHLTVNLSQRRSKKQKNDGKKQAGLATIQVERNGADVDSRYLMPSRRKVKNKSAEVTGNLSYHLVPTPSPEETFLKIRYTDVSQLEVVKYLNLSSWMESLNDYKRFCTLLTKSEIEKLALVYQQKKLVTHPVSSGKEISSSRGKENHFSVKDQQNLLDNKSEGIFHTSVLSGQLPLIVDVHHDDLLDPNVTRPFAESISTLAHLPADCFSDNEGKHWSLECVENSADYQFNVEKDHDISAKPMFCPHSNDGEAYVFLRSATVNDLYETCNSTELPSFQEHLYSLLRLHTIFESHFFPDAKPWWQDIGFLHVYNIAVAGIFFYLVIT